MISCSELLDCLKAAGVDFSVGDPDSLLKNFCACLTDTRPTAHVIAANEGGAIALYRFSIVAFSRKIRATA